MVELAFCCGEGVDSLLTCTPDRFGWLGIRLEGNDDDTCTGTKVAFDLTNAPRIIELNIISKMLMEPNSQRLGKNKHCSTNLRHSVQH